MRDRRRRGTTRGRAATAAAAGAAIAGAALTALIGLAAHVIDQRSLLLAQVTLRLGVGTGTGRAPRTCSARAAHGRAAAARTAHVNVDAPALQQRLKPVLNRGANMAMAADGFRSAEQFATVAHAARNTEVPFMVLKHRVLNEGKSLAQAIRESKPAIDAANEASQARAQARSDIAAIAG